MPANRRRAASAVAQVSVMLVLSMPLALAVLSASTPAIGEDLTITVDLDYRTVNAGEEIEFSSVVTNTGAENSPPLYVAMNIVKTAKGVLIATEI